MIKTLPNNNFLILKISTNLTQILHRIRLLQFSSTHKLPDISIPPKDFQQDNEVVIQHDDLYALAWKELYQGHPTHHENSQSPEPELIPPTSETDATTHPNTLSPDPVHEPEDISNHPDTQADDPTLDFADEPEDSAPFPKSPRKSKYNLRHNPTSTWKTDFAYYNSIEANSDNWIIPNHRPDDDPEKKSFSGPGHWRRPEIRKLKRPQALTWTAILWLNSKSPQSIMALALTLLLYDSDGKNTEGKY